MSEFGWNAKHKDFMSKLETSQTLLRISMAKEWDIGLNGLGKKHKLYNHWKACYPCDFTLNCQLLY